MSKTTPLSPYESTVLRWMRVLAALMVFFCHVFQSDYIPIPILGQSLNSAVPIFFIMSGILLSKGRTAPESPCRWLLHRYIRLLIPYWLCFSLVLSVSFFITNGEFPHLAAWNIIPIAGLTERYIDGGGHLWYITHILICYLYALLLYGINAHCRKWRLDAVILLIVGYILLLFTFQLFSPGILCVLLASIFSFSIGFFFSDHLFRCCRKLTILLPVSLVLRLGGKYLFDDSPLYTSFLAIISQQMLGLSIFALVASLCLAIYKRGKIVVSLPKNIHYFETISYEFYLTHGFLLLPPLGIHFFQSTLCNLIVAFLLSILSASVIHILSKHISKPIK